MEINDSRKREHSLMPAKRWITLASLALVFLMGTAASIFPRLLFAEDLERIADQQRTVRSVYDARKGYQSSLERLRNYYSQINHEENLYWVEKELDGLSLISQGTVHSRYGSSQRFAQTNKE